MSSSRSTGCASWWPTARVGSMASVHYSFMGAFPPAAAEPHAQHLAGLLKADKVDAALLVPV